MVVGNRLGAINHALLTLDHAACMNLKVYGYILNDIESESTPATATNAATLEEMTRVPCVGKIPFLRPQGWGAGAPETRADLGSLIERHVQLDYLKQIMGAALPGSEGVLPSPRAGRPRSR